jgi:hypothetical protein
MSDRRWYTMASWEPLVKAALLEGAGAHSPGVSHSQIASAKAKHLPRMGSSRQYHGKTTYGAAPAMDTRRPAALWAAIVGKLVAAGEITVTGAIVGTVEVEGVSGLPAALCTVLAQGQSLACFLVTTTAFQAACKALGHRGATKAAAAQAGFTSTDVLVAALFSLCVRGAVTTSPQLWAGYISLRLCLRVCLALGWVPEGCTEASWAPTPEPAPPPAPPPLSPPAPPPRSPPAPAPAPPSFKVGRHWPILLESSFNSLQKMWCMEQHQGCEKYVKRCVQNASGFL